MSRSAGEGPPLGGLQLVVPMAEATEIVETGGSSLGVVHLPVVGLQSLAHATAGDHTLLVPFQNGDAEGLGDVAAQPGDGGHVHPVGEDQVEEIVAQSLSGVADRDRTHSGDLTELSLPHRAPT